MTSIRKVENCEIAKLSKVASAIVKEHYDPLLGSEQNDYMIKKFQSQEALISQIKDGYRYYWALEGDDIAGFFAIYPRDNKMYLSKFYLKKEFRGRHIADKMLEFIKTQTKNEGMSRVFLNVNRGNINTIQIYEHLGFVKIREEKTDIGHGYYMDDYVMECEV